MGIIKTAAMEAIAASNPTSLVFGTVSQENPLKITLEQKMTLSEKFLILGSLVQDFDVEMTVEHKTEKTKVTHDHRFTDVTSSGPVPSNTETEDIEHDHEYKGKKSFKVHLGLKQGEKVMLIQLQGGQKYLVLDRVRG